ncbi:DNA-binding transcription factor yap1 [Myotisia sp. PD_48]|nr:DNA-binding transcription factor yap1 [Myotisia sp. PD_48]
MSNYDSSYHDGPYLSADQQNLLLAALSSNNQPKKGTKEDAMPSEISPGLHLRNLLGGDSLFDSPPHDISGPGSLILGPDQSPYLDFDLDADFDLPDDSLIGALPESLPNIDEQEGGEKRKSLDGREEDEDNGKKRRGSDDKTAKKPGRKPLTSEPTTKRKAQNRAAQRAFRERKEKHLKDLEVKVEHLEKQSRNTTNENTLLRAQVGKLQVELKEYRKRLSWINSGSSLSPTSSLYGSSTANTRNPSHSNNEFSFEFPKFGDLPGAHLYGNVSTAKPQNGSNTSRSSSTVGIQQRIPGVLSRDRIQQSAPLGMASRFNRPGNPNGYYNTSTTASPMMPRPQNTFGSSLSASGGRPTSHSENGSSPLLPHAFDNPLFHYTNSPSASSDSQPSHISSINTSPEPITSPPSTQKLDFTVNGNSNPRVKSSSPLSESERKFYDNLEEACGCAENPIPAALLPSTNNQPPSTKPGNGSESGNTITTATESSNPTPNNDSSTVAFNDDIPDFDWLAQQNGGHFDPVLFGDYREPQDAILSQGFNGFFDDAFPLPDVENFDLSDPKSRQVNQAQNKDYEEVVPGEDRSQLLSCTNIWNRLQSNEKFRNGEIDVDDLCTELKAKARCSEGGVVVDRKDVDDIMTRAK